MQFPCLLSFSPCLSLLCCEPPVSSYCSIVTASKRAHCPRLQAVWHCWHRGIHQRNEYGNKLLRHLIFTGQVDGWHSWDSVEPNLAGSVSSAHCPDTYCMGRSVGGVFFFFYCIWFKANQLQRLLMLSMHFLEARITPPRLLKWEFCLTLISCGEICKRLIKKSKQWGSTGICIITTLLWMLPEALEINRAWGGGPVLRWIWQRKTTTLTLITRWTLTHIPFSCLALPAKNVLNLRQLLYQFSVLVKPRLGFLAKLAKRTRRLIIFHKSWRLSPNAMRGIPKGAGQCSVFPVAINTDGSAATQGRQQCKIFFVPVWREKAPVVEIMWKANQRQRTVSLPLVGKANQVWSFQPGVTMTLGDATCHPVPESGNLSRSSPFAECVPPSGIYCVQHTWKKNKKKWRKASV